MRVYGDGERAVMMWNYPVALEEATGGNEACTIARGWVTQ